MSLTAAFKNQERDTTREQATANFRGERIAATVLGTGLVLTGLKKRSASGAIAAVAGGWLLYRAVTSR
ncbi:hypothetical protein [Halostagnicola kamekurae]|uniref:DUF2892 domain-containing protein n=1 Tax=Halostagnicola kamekurae TaxID=619731 RepID=A0A1I6U6D6_9EURY|nr:hypothetical protein [Halostagnicola kamekurae]SFS97003.1 hypothetical protein SAMN04488556_3590 [Halostagnicola kamekurae]